MLKTLYKNSYYSENNESHSISQFTCEFQYIFMFPVVNELCALLAHRHVTLSGVM